MFHKNLKRLRTKKKLSQEEMATYLGITRQGYSKYENEKSEPSLQMLMKIADKFDVTVDQLIGYQSSIVKEPTFAEESLFPFDKLGIDQKDYDSLSAYQQEALNWAANNEYLQFKNKSDNIMDMIERIEIAYEVDKAMKKRKKNDK